MRCLSNCNVSVTTAAKSMHSRFMGANAIQIAFPTDGLRAQDQETTDIFELGFLSAFDKITEPKHSIMG